MTASGTMIWQNVESIRTCPEEFDSEPAKSDEALYMRLPSLKEMPFIQGISQ